MSTVNKKSTLAHHKKEFLKEAADLWDDHQDELEFFLRRSKKQCLAIKFNVVIDASEAKEVLTVNIDSVGDHVKDKRSKTLEDPQQGLFKELAGDPKEN